MRKIKRPNDEYIHVLKGRLRIKISATRNRPQIAHKFAETLRHFDGIKSVDVNLVTGNALVTFDPNKLSSKTIISLIKRKGFVDNVPLLPQAHGLQSSKLSRADLLSEMGTAVGKEVFTMIMGAVAKQAFTALVKGLV